MANSKKQKNPKLLRDYKDSHPTCEVGKWMRKYGSMGLTTKELLDPTSSDLNHIFGGKGMRWDLLSNIINVNRPVHDWFHRDPVNGRIICLWVKLRNNELDLAEIHQASGCHLEGWLLMHDMMHDGFRFMWNDLLRYCESHG